MEIRQLKYFLAVADYRGFGSAAASLFVTRQAVSKAISQLEEELKLDLFLRQANGVFLTPAGMKFYDYAKHLVAEYDKMQTEMLDYGNSYSQKIRVAFSVGITRLFEEKIHIGDRPNLEIRCEEIPDRDLRNYLLDRHSDLAVGSGCLDGPNFVSTAVLTSEIGILALPDWDPEDILESASLSGRMLACISADTGMDQFCTGLGIVPDFRGYDYFRLMCIAAEGRCGLLLPKILSNETLPGLKWYALADHPRWTVYVSHMKSVESNMLLWSALEEIRSRILKTVDLQKVSV